MEKRSLLLTLLSAFLMTVGVPPVSAYLSPCEVFGNCNTGGDATRPAAPEEGSQNDAYVDRTDITTVGAAPALQRDAEEAVALQQAMAAAARDAAYRDLMSSSSASTAIAAEDTSPSLGLLGGNNDETEYNLRMARMEENADGVTIVINGDGSVAQNGTVLHSGAPRVTATGPESVLMLSLLVLAGLCTLAFVSFHRKRPA